MKGVADFIEDNFELVPEIKIHLHPYQRDILLCPSKFRIINKARQLGISTVMAWEALATTLLKNNQTILFVSVAERQAWELLKYVKRVLHNLKRRKHIILIEDSKSVLRFENGSRIISLPNNPNTVQGFRADRIYIDEYSLFERDKEMLEAILPSISYGGYITIISRPLGQRGEFYRIFREAKEKKNDFVPFEIDYKQCTSEEYQKQVARFRNIMDEITFREAYCCEFIDEGSSYFPYEMLLECTDHDISLPRPEMDLRFGVDFGRKQNSTVIVVAEKRNDLFIVRDMKEFLGVSYSSQLGFLGRKIEDLKPEAVKVDEFGVGVRLYEELREKHGSVIVPVQLSTNTKDKMISDLRIRFEDKKIRIPDNEKLRQQLHALQRKVQGGYIKWEPGKTEEFGRHDDYVWALAMAVSEETVSQLRYFKIGSDNRGKLTGFVPEFKTQLIEDEEEKFE